MRKLYAKATRDFDRVIKMGPLVTYTLGTGATSEIAPAREVVLPTKADTVWQFTSAKKRDAFMAAVNAENPGAVVAS